MAQFKLTNNAVKDLSDIWNYTFDAWSESQADKYYINESYIIRAFNGSQTYEKGNPKIEITVFDLKKKTQSTSAFYFSWFCEA